jgi:hypothetical protein
VFLIDLRGGAIAFAMRRLPLLAALAVLALLCTAGSPRVAEARRGGLRCGNRLVNLGDSIDQVFRRCGQPTFRKFETEYVSFETAPGFFVNRPIAIEIWTYNRGPHQFVRYLKFREGDLVEVDEGTYGY